MVNATTYCEPTPRASHPWVRSEDPPRRADLDAPSGVGQRSSSPEPNSATAFSAWTLEPDITTATAPAPATRRRCGSGEFVRLIHAEGRDEAPRSVRA